MTHAPPLPKISVITPSFNQGRLIEQTILSVISQQYPLLEFFILDGGSTDNTVEIIRKYEKHITYWHSKKDNGQAAAINEGFNRATGSVLCWINSDDMYLPGVFNRVAAYFTEESSPRIVFGDCIHVNDESGKVRGSSVTLAHERLDLSLCDYIIQPSSFWNRSAWTLTGQLNEAMNFAFDWDWFIRAKRAGVDLLPLAGYLSIYRIHEHHKSGSGGAKRLEELKAVVSTYNNDRLSKAFNKWVRIHSRYSLASSGMSLSQRFDLAFLNSLVRWSCFPSLTAKEYASVVAMK
ncbi:MAG TPA: glycosyltransferase family 2 protein [Terriglobia bacterium]|nr:glycosyltransferase family 2 protein [Terriglobia bacterium]